jgi:hypothetical protein
MMTGMFSRAQASQTGLSAGSSTLSREPSCFVLLRPRPLAILRPTAPFFTAASRSATAFSAQPGPPAPFHCTLANTAKRSGACCADEVHLLLHRRRIAAAAQVHEHLEAHRVHLAISLSMVAAVGPVWLWMSMTGYFAFGTSVSFVTSVERGR